MLFLLLPSRSHSSPLGPLPTKTILGRSKGNHSLLSPASPLVFQAAPRFSILHLRFLHFQLLVSPPISKIAAVGHLEVVLLTICHFVEISPGSFPVGCQQVLLIILFLWCGCHQVAVLLLTLVAIMVER